MIFDVLVLILSTSSNAEHNIPEWRRSALAAVAIMQLSAKSSLPHALPDSG
jgi:hypothetical protein